ncbi:protein PARTING DANCERS homolog isoform X3 [Miscanthus floridulus]|uniref:protein PARTING DANCERS homolog isoform X3 n=1 Tax=Miscanthus floridulus TaxID=154761 RepID=UPI00345A0C4B
MTGRPPPYARSPARRQASAGDEHPPPAAMLGPPPPLVDSSAGRGVCIMSASWRDKQRPDLVNFVAAFLATNLYRLNFMALSPDFIFSHGGQSVAFIFETDWLPEREAAVFSRVSTLKRQFKYLYVVVVVRSAEQNESFNQSYFKYGMELGCPTFVPVCDPEMGFEKIVRIAHARGVCKQKDIVAAMRTEREQAVQCMDAFLRVVTSIPGIDSHDANALAQAIGSIEAIAKASKESILENTDLSTEKAKSDCFESVPG